MDGGMDGWMEGWMDGWMDGWIFPRCLVDTVELYVSLYSASGHSAFSTVYLLYVRLGPAGLRGI